MSNIQNLIQPLSLEEFTYIFSSILDNPLYDISNEDLKLYIKSPELLYYKYSKNSFDFKGYIPAIGIDRLEISYLKALMYFVNYLEESNFEQEINYDYSNTIDDQDKKVIASFICWLPSNVGCCFIQDAFNFHKNNNLKYKDAFQLSWNKTNKRSLGINNTYRILEYLLASHEKLDCDRGLINFKPESISCLDYEIIEHLVDWLSTKKGYIFIAEAIPKTKLFLPDY